MNDGERKLLWRLVGADAVSRLGDAVTSVALPLAAVLVLDVSPAGLALIGAAQAIPILLLSLPAGAWVDHRARRWPILVAADVGRAALMLAIPAAAVAGVLSLPLLIAVAFGSAVLGTFFDVAFAGWLPRLLKGDSLHVANARVELGRSVAIVSGPALGGVLVGLITAPLAMLVDACSFIASGALITSVRGREPAWPPRTERQSLRHQLSAGVAFVLRQPMIRAVHATAGINNFSRAVAMSVALLYLVDEAHLGAAEIGIAFALGNTGYVVGAAVSRRITRRIGVGWTMQLGVSLFAPSMVAFALAPAQWAGMLFAAMVFAHGFGISIHNVNQVTIRQLLTPDELRARVAAVTRLVIFGAMPVGTLVGGLIAEVAGVRTAIVVGGFGFLAGSLPYLAAHAWRIRTLEDLEPQNVEGKERPEVTIGAR
ncbi:MAG TPA: MFS transporter [Candidatus Limnocylindria bacterium]|nr:MFS transporter [Candidatus Limnocylindria bacterium]